MTAGDLVTTNILGLMTTLLHRYEIRELNKAHHYNTTEDHLLFKKGRSMILSYNFEKLEYRWRTL